MSRNRVSFDWQLSTQEFMGLCHVMQAYVEQVRDARRNNALQQLDEDSLLLASYAPVLTASRVQSWKKRREREQRNRLRDKRYSFVLDLLLLKVLLRVLPTKVINADVQALLSRVHQLHTNLQGPSPPAITPVSVISSVYPSFTGEQLLLES